MSEILVEGVTKTYGDVRALDDVSLAVEEGGIFGLLGTNGAGKTTLFRLLIGHDTPDAGTIEVAGLSAGDGAVIRQRVGYLPEHAGFPSSFTGREVLAFHADMRGVPAAARSEQIEEALATVRLSDVADRAVGGYSKGMNRRLGLATVLLAEPRVLLLDEPTSGLDPMGVSAFHEAIERLTAETSITVVFSSHTLSEVERLCDRVAILDQGRVRASGGVEELRRSLDEAVTLRLWVSVEEAVPEVIAHLQGKPVVQEVERHGATRLRVRCAADDVCDLLSAVRQRVSVEGFEIRKPGMAEVFRRAVQSRPEREPASVSSQPGQRTQVGDGR
ncbi:MAG: ATP-binding cassette domain-containing protein [Salinibacter sp.]